MALPLGISLREAWLANTETTRQQLLNARLEDSEVEDDIPRRPGRRVLSGVHVPRTGEDVRETEASDLYESDSQEPSTERLRRGLDKVDLSTFPSDFEMVDARSDTAQDTEDDGVYEIDDEGRLPINPATRTLDNAVQHEEVVNRAANPFIAGFTEQMREQIQGFNSYWETR